MSSHVSLSKKFSLWKTPSQSRFFPNSSSNPFLVALNRSIQRQKSPFSTTLRKKSKPIRKSLLLSRLKSW
jgi:hypothetical protein